MIGLICNPPYNLKWQHPMFASVQERFAQYGVPPESNANYAFILEGINMTDDRSAYILPNGILTSDQKDELAIRRALIESNLIDAIILNPDGMFESTSIPTCILVINKRKTTSTIELIDCRQKYDVEVRDQNGQYGGSSHEGRTYHKELKIYTDEIIDDVISCIEDRKSVDNYCKSVSIEDIKKNQYIIQPSRYTSKAEMESYHRSYEDIVNDLNSVIRDKNNVKVTMNETIAKQLGFDQIYDLEKTGNIATKYLNDMLKGIEIDAQIMQYDYLATSKNKNEIKIENNDKDRLSEIITLVINMYKSHLIYLNNRENRYLAELRDALLPELMSGKIDVTNLEVKRE